MRRKRVEVEIDICYRSFNDRWVLDYGDGDDDDDDGGHDAVVRRRH